MAVNDSTIFSKYETTTDTLTYLKVGLFSTFAAGYMPYAGVALIALKFCLKKHNIGSLRTK